MERVRMVTSSIALAAVLAFGMMVNTSPAEAGFCCKASATIRLQPTPAGMATGVLGGVAEIDECLGMTFLRVVVIARVPDGTVFLPTLPGAEPILGEWFEITQAHGQTVMQGLTLATLTGRILNVVDQNFTPVLTGQF